MRYARICPNTNGWIQPSYGYKGGRGSFPGKNGFGFEEWLFSSPVLQSGSLKGLRAGFIQAYKNQAADFKDDVTLYYLDSQMNRFTAIEITQCRRITQQEATDIFNQYNASNPNFISIMQTAIKGFNLQNYPHLDMFNVVFDPNSAILLNPQTHCPNGHTYYTHLYK